MQNRYFEEPYRFVPPYRSTFWCRTLQSLLPMVLKREFRVTRWEFRGSAHLALALRQRAGILLAPNHCRLSDPPVLGMLGRHVGQYFYYIASWHLFKQSRWDHWKLNRLGGFSVFREGPDREAIRESSRILTEAERPIVIFPEGTWVRQNDRLSSLQGGLGLIARRAARRAARPILVIPVAVKYWFLEDPRPALGRRLDALERRLHWAPQTALDLQARLEKLTGALLAVKEIEHFDEAQQGELSYRIEKICDLLLSDQERKYFGQPSGGQVLHRVRALGRVHARRLQRTADVPSERDAVRREIDLVAVCQHLAGHDLEYLTSLPTLERLAETLQRIEEALTDQERPLAETGVVVQLGDPLPVSDYPIDRRRNAPDCPDARRQEDPLMDRIAGDVQSMLDGLLADGPPTSWNTPSDPARQSELAGHRAEVGSWLGART